MSVAQASGVYKAMQKRIAQQAILESLSEDTQKLWEEFYSTPYWNKLPNKTGLNITIFLVVIYFFFKGERISFKKAKKEFINSIDKLNKRYEELSGKEEIISTLNLFKQKGVAWGY